VRSLIAAAVLFTSIGTAQAFAATSGGGLTLPSADEPAADSGAAKFPVKARVSWGDGLGAGRGHQGQDLMANCGRPVVAAKAGKVTTVDYQASGAGNYAVVRGTSSKFDYVYMHMLKTPRVSTGDRIKAGQTIGYVGSTGRSSACHLHFEMWTRPGWYKGGTVSDPTPYLRRWKRSS
jgi:murein DD-endopeptidase MepM/ murein hydrolase activator NlpD